jgi:hypothetical protein
MKLASKVIPVTSFEWIERQVALRALATSRQGLPLLPFHFSDTGLAFRRGADCQCRPVAVPNQHTVERIGAVIEYA